MLRKTLLRSTPLVVFLCGANILGGFGCHEARHTHVVVVKAPVVNVGGGNHGYGVMA